MVVDASKLSFAASEGFSKEARMGGVYRVFETLLLGLIDAIDMYQMI